MFFVLLLHTWNEIFCFTRVDAGNYLTVILLIDCDTAAELRYCCWAVVLTFSNDAEDG